MGTILILLLIAASTHSQETTTLSLDTTVFSNEVSPPENITVASSNRTQENVTNTAQRIGISSLMFQSFARRDDSFCNGNFTQRKLELQPGGRTCEFLIWPSSKDFCWVQIELIRWEGECTRSWLEANGQLECGDLKGERWLELKAKGIPMRAASDKGKLVIQQVPCRAPTSTTSLPTVSSPSLTTKPIHSSLSISPSPAPTLLLSEQLPNNDKVGSDPLIPSTESCIPSSLCQQSNEKDKTFNDLPFSGFLAIQNSSSLNTNVVDTSRAGEVPVSLSYAPYIPNPSNSPTSFRNPYMQESYLTISNPGYPNQSPSGDCILDLPLPPSCNILFRFVFFDVGQGDPSRLTCTTSWLEIAGYRFCGCQTGLMWTPPPQASSKGNLRFIFHGTGRFWIDIIFVPFSSHSFRYSPQCSWQCQPQRYPNFQTAGNQNIYPGQNQYPGYQNQERPPQFLPTYDPNRIPTYPQDNRPALNFMNQATSNNIYPQVNPTQFRPTNPSSTIVQPEYLNQIPPTGMYPGINPTQFRPNNVIKPQTDTFRLNKPVGSQDSTIYSFLNQGQFPSNSYYYPVPSQPFQPQNPLQYSPVPSQETSRCEVINSADGYLYPQRQGGNMCYRFSPAGRRDSCGTAVMVENLNIPHSPGCQDQFISFGQRSSRYCGSMIPTQPVMLERDDCLFARIGQDGDFKMRYRNLECGCDAAFRQNEVAIRGPSGNACTYTFLKSSPNVCGLEVTLENLNLDCAHESLIVGGQYYCGDVHRKVVLLDFLNPTTEIRYTGNGRSHIGSFMFIARQLTNCPPAVILGRQAKSDDECIQELTASNGKVISPRSPSFRTSECKYLFRTPQEICWIRVDIDGFDIPWTVGCQENYVAIDGVKYCGSQLNNSTKVLTVNGGTAEVTYRAGPGSFWSFSFSSLPCRQNILARSSHFNA